MHGRRVGVLGAGRQAVETAGYCREAGLDPAFFVEESPPEYERTASDYGAPLLTFDDSLEGLMDYPVIAAVGDPSVRRRLVERWPGRSYFTLVSAHAWVASDSDIGEGCQIAPMSAVNRFCKLGDHVVVNVGAVLAHDVVAGDFATISPRCAVGGLVSIGCEVFLGIGSIIRDRVTIGDRAFVAAGAVVVEDVESGQTVMGVPATPRREGKEA